MRGPKTIEELTEISVADLLLTAAGALDDGKAVAFQLRLPCGCVQDIAFQKVGKVDKTHCGTYFPEPPTETCH